MPARKRRRRTRRKSSAKTLIITRQRVGLIFLLVGALYFFSLSFAPDGLVMQWRTSAASIALGNIGMSPFFALCMIVGGLILWRGAMMRVWIKIFVATTVVLSALLNFPLLDNPDALYTNYGGYVSWPVLFGLGELFGNSAMASKIIIVLFAIGIVVWIGYVFDVSLKLPSISFVSSSGPDSIRRSRKSASGSTRSSQSSSRASVERFGDHKSRKGSNDSLVKKMLKSKIKSTMASKETKKELIRHTFPSDLPTYSSLEVLQTAKDKNTHIDESFLITKVKNLQSKLAEFNVPVEVEGFDVGPSVIQIRVRPQAGIKVSAIENLQNDVALSLKAKALRIVAPIPGTDCIGIQLPNPKPQMVKLADMLNSPVFLERMNDNYTNLSLGKNVAGQEVIKSLEDMPHLLIAGATGSGKSVGVNDFILALMYQNTPSDLKFLMIDPKQVEMELYAGLPYLLAPIVTESDKALRLLKWSVDEMESRYTMLKHAKVKHMSEYNEKYPDQTMYRIVIIIDELADLMMSGNKKEVELCITRIAQKARAVGIHLIVATQRPSVNVITGLIKANLPTRIAFSVVSQIDSRTILGTKGAEELVGKGDLLYMDPSTKYPERVQAPFVTTKEINRTVRYLKTKYMKNISEADMYHPELMAVLDGTATVAVDIGGGGSGSSDDQLIEKAITLVTQSRKASATMLQRKLNVGFARAARIMDALEARGIVGPQEGSKAREVLV